MKVVLIISLVSYVQRLRLGKMPEATETRYGFLKLSKSLVSVSEYSIFHDYSRGDSICNVVIGCGMN